MKEYVYDDLDDSASEIRLLILLPGEKDDPVQALLLTTPLTRRSVPRYEALSYAWGSQGNPMHIKARTASAGDIKHIFGGDTSLEGQIEATLERLAISTADTSGILSGEISITRNLGIASPYLRIPHRPRALWVDALCVNQANPAERGQQVQRMAGIFRKATRVLFWVGEGRDDSDCVMRLFETISSKVGYDYNEDCLVAKSADVADAHVST